MSTVTYRPNAAGSNTAISSQEPSSTSHYDKVDDVTADDNTTYIWTFSLSYELDTFNFANPSETGTISQITVYARCARNSSAYAKIAIFTSGQAAAYGSEITLTDSWVTSNYTWSTNPWTSSAWSWSDLNSLEIGVALKAGSGGASFCTQVYIVITYITPSGRSYAKVVGL